MNIGYLGLTVVASFLYSVRCAGSAPPETFPGTPGSSSPAIPAPLRIMVNHHPRLEPVVRAQLDAAEGVKREILNSEAYSGWSEENRKRLKVNLDRIAERMVFVDCAINLVPIYERKGELEICGACFSSLDSSLEKWEESLVFSNILALTAYIEKKYVCFLIRHWLKLISVFGDFYSLSAIYSLESFCFYETFFLSMDEAKFKLCDEFFELYLEASQEMYSSRDPLFCKLYEKLCSVMKPLFAKRNTRFGRIMRMLESAPPRSPSPTREMVLALRRKLRLATSSKRDAVEAGLLTFSPADSEGSSPQ